MKKYKITYFKKDEKTEKLINLGTQEIFYFGDEDCSLAGKAYRWAQGSQKDACSLEFKEI